MEWVVLVPLLLLTLPGPSLTTISNLRLCGDPECKEPVAEGITLIRYPSNDKDILSFSNNLPVKIYSKEAGNRNDLWEVEIKGKRGYVPKKYIRELKVFKAKLDYEVPTELVHQEHEDKPESLNDKKESKDKDTDFNAKSTHDQVAINGEDIEIFKAELLDSKDDTKEKVEDITEEPGDQMDSVDTEAEAIDDGNDDDDDNDGEDDEEEEVAEEEENSRDFEDEGHDKEKIESGMSKTEIGEGVSDGSEETYTKDKSSDVLDDLHVAGSATEESSLVSDSSSSVVELTQETSTLVKHDSSNLSPLESSINDFEVIDGTTIYFNEDLATLASEIQSTEAIKASTVMEKSHESVETLSVLPESSMKTPQDESDISRSMITSEPGKTVITTISSSQSFENINPSVTVTPSPSSDVAESKQSHQHKTDSQTAPDIRKLIIPSKSADKEKGSAIEMEEADKQEGQAEINDGIITSSSPEVNTDTTTVSPLESNTKPLDQNTIEKTIETKTEPYIVSTSNGEEHSPEELDMSESLLEDVEKKVATESPGFFSSWFGSSEDTSTEKDGTLPQNTDSKAETDENLADKIDIDSILPLKNSKANIDDANVDISTTNIPPNLDDLFENPVGESASFPDSTQAPFPASVDNVASSILQPTPPSVANSADSAELATTEFSPTPEPSSDWNFNQSDPGDGGEENMATAGEVETEARPSTARPLYAEPEPSSTPHASVDSDDVPRDSDIADKGTSEDDEVNLAERSLTEKFLRTSHNLLVSIAGALQLPEGLAFGIEAEMAEPEMSSGMMVFLGVVVVTVVTIYLVHLIMLKLSRESPMLEALNQIERESRILSAENQTLHEQLCHAKAELNSVMSRMTDSKEDVSELDSQLELIKGEYACEKAQMEEKIVQLEQELEETAANGMEMHKMLSEMLSSQKDASTFQASVDHLQNMLDGQREKVENLNSDLALKTRLNEELHTELSSTTERATKLDSQVQQLTQSLKELSSSKEEMNKRLEKESKLVEELQKVNNALSSETGEAEGTISSLNSELTALQNTISQLRESVETKDSELQVAKECLKQLRLTSDDDLAAPDDDKLNSLFDAITVKAELQCVKRERDKMQDELHDSEMAQKNLEDAMLSIRSEVVQLKSHHDEAIHAKEEALSKLAILTKYFEEKEAQLTKELESQEGLRAGAEGVAAAGASKLHNYTLELSAYKAQVESLRKELEDQENSYKAQIASYEQKAHDNWLQARAAERRHEEQRQENSQLRTRLTLMQKERDVHIQSGTTKSAKRIDANGSATSPGPGVEGEVVGNHRDVDSPPVVPHPLHAPPPMLPMMFPPGAPLPPVPPHGLPPGVPPHPPLPGVPPPHGLPPPPFLSGEAPFMGPPLPPLPGDRRLPPAGGMSSPPFRRSGSPSFDHINDRYSPASEHSHFSDRHYSPPPRHRPGSPDLHRRNHSPDRRSDRTRSPDRRLDRMRSPDRRSNRRTPDRRLVRRSPERHFSTRSPDGYSRHRSSPQNYYDHSDYNCDEIRMHHSHMKGKKTSTPLNSSDRWKSDS